MQGSAILWNTQQIVSISFLSQKNKRKASKQAFEEGFSFSFQGSYSEQYTFHNSSLLPINTEHTLLSQEQTVSSNLYVTIQIDEMKIRCFEKYAWYIKKLYADLVILSLEAHHILWYPKGLSETRNTEGFFQISTQPWGNNHLYFYRGLF